MKALGPKINQKAFDFYEATFASVNAGATYTLESFPALYKHTLLRELKGKFTRPELMVMLDVTNGLFLTPGIAGQHIAMECSDGIALDGLDKKWNVDAELFLPRLQALTLFQCNCLEVWCRAFWEQNDNEDAASIEKWVEQLTERENSHE
jgi:hypothetical protein